ncbi:dihydrofolate reductase [Bacteroides sp. 519]|uniref:dihydrofolate reductase n=1 Tax=Bacteroides sp. 519 TaxID=2302937 RepID=UPI0013D6274E|nr:dihydrofolate reductase [Bacteroides sp. 519]NDV58025.1 dihydrofolate reductase [Bacteroides sp. 519]
MNISLILAVSENNVIGHNNQMLWRLSNDLKRFKALTTGHAIVMGRKTFESLGRPLPGRKNIVITRNPDYEAPGCEVVNSIDDAIKAAGNDNEVFIIGGGELYTQMWEKADKLYLTQVHTTIEGETTVPNVSGYWQEIHRESFMADEKNEFNYTFIDYIKNDSESITES